MNALALVGASLLANSQLHRATPFASKLAPTGEGAQ